MDSHIEQWVRLPNRRNSERRASVRFQLTLEVRYSVGGRRRSVESGSGRTLDISSSGMSFTADRPLSIGQELDLFVDWPVLLDGVIPLQLVVVRGLRRTWSSSVYDGCLATTGLVG
jgi:c-di-GMP-binding flagellar brake protein YcgR